MAKFSEVLDELEAGKSLRRDEKWERITRIYYDGSNLVQQCGDGEPYIYNIDWQDLAATDWSIVTTQWIERPIASTTVSSRTNLHGISDRVAV